MKGDRGYSAVLLLILIFLAVAALIIYGLYSFRQKEEVIQIKNFGVVPNDQGRPTLSIDFKTKLALNLSLVNPDGKEIDSTAIKSGEGSIRLRLADLKITPKAGTYILVVTSSKDKINKSFEFKGADLSITSTKYDTSCSFIGSPGNEKKLCDIGNFELSLENRGDLPAYTFEIILKLGNKTLSEPFQRSIYPAEKARLVILGANIFSNLEPKTHTLLFVAKDENGNELMNYPTEVDFSNV